jgi:hypothetical protein
VALGIFDYIEEAAPLPCATRSADRDGRATVRDRGIAAWPRLPDHVRDTVVMLVQAAVTSP